MNTTIIWKLQELTAILANIEMNQRPKEPSYKIRLNILICHVIFPSSSMPLSLPFLFSFLSSTPLYLKGTYQLLCGWLVVMRQPYLQHSPANCQPLIQQPVPADQCKAVLISFLLGKKWTSLPAATILPVLFPSQTKGLKIRI